MKILKITKQRYSEEEQQILTTNGFYLDTLTPTLFSAMTAMKISKAVDTKDYDYIIVEKMEDAMAAVSSKKIAKKKNYKIIYIARPNTQSPKSIPTDIIKNVDTWIMPSQRLFDEFPPSCKNKTIIQPVKLSAAKTTTPTNESKEAKKHLLWIGDITNGERLKEAIMAIDELAPVADLTICGAGNAKTVMPIVRFTRGLDNKHHIIWRGEEYNEAKETEACDAAIITGQDITAKETTIANTGKPLLHPYEIAEWIHTGKIKENRQMSVDKYLMTLREALMRNV